MNTYIPKLRAGALIKGMTPEGLKGSGKVLGIQGHDYVVDMVWEDAKMRKGIFYEGARMIDENFVEQEKLEESATGRLLSVDRGGFKLCEGYTTVKLEQKKGILVPNWLIHHNLGVKEATFRASAGCCGLVKIKVETEKAMLLTCGKLELWVPKKLVRDARVTKKPL